MATTKFKGQPVKVIGEFIKVGTVAPDFELVKTDLSSFAYSGGYPFSISVDIRSLPS